MKFRALALGATIGFLAAVVPSCGKSSNCGPQNCNGCCNSGTCVASPGNSANATCGSSGNSCVACGAGQTCNSSFQCVGGGTGGGSGGGSGGDGGVCNATTCANGCCAAGRCIPATAAAQNATNCGTGGAACAMCASGQTCQTGVCRTGGTSLKFGDPCTQDSECAALGGTFKCKKTTNPGGAVYQDGYCTKICASNADCSSVDAGSVVCFGSAAPYGENDAICWRQCGGTAGTCRTGYGCYGITSGGVSLGGACWLDPVPTPDAGPPSDKVGLPCTTYTQCANPPDPQYAACLTEYFNLADGGQSTTPTGYTGGYCTANCQLGTAICGTNGLCFGDFPEMGSDSCVAKCTTPSVGQSSCRTGYVCTQYVTTFADGGQNPSTDGFCNPSCNSPGGECSDAGYCDAGYCLPK